MKKIYKHFKNSFFKYYYSKIKIGTKKFSNSFLFKNFKINNFQIKIYKIKNCRLFTNTLDVAVIKDRVLLNGPSIQIRNNINKDITKNAVVSSGTPKFYKIINNRVFSLLSGLDSNTNYYHWFFDTISKIYFYKKFFLFKKNDFFLVPGSNLSYQRESLKSLGIKNILNANDIKHFKFNELITTNFTNFNSNPPLEIIKFLRNFFLNKYRFSRNEKIKIFLNRDTKNSHRDIFNKNEIITYLKKNKFKIINPSKLSFSAQVRYFNNAKFIIGMHGAAFTNIIFCKKNTKILELKLSGSRNNTISNIAKKLKLNIRSLYFKNINTNKKIRTWDGLINVNLKKIINYL